MLLRTILTIVAILTLMFVVIYVSGLCSGSAAITGGSADLVPLIDRSISAQKCGSAAIILAT